ncbi:MobV family relaxase [Silvimonas amylolytica]|uniref:Plasmid recombination enzyme n=1 Tax=Silvimonas amylolytica TaxID=449663 RepID=A0ABQ2PNL5_9NEIS|nr:MobV family relaxase [Silvimonas amylolytica]GGP26811.1 hypothetical protein GCM10010971_26300 [Silvimonas amylolytica]
MTDYLILRIAKLKTAAAILGSGQHTWREIPTPNADASRTHQNQDLKPVTNSRALLMAVNARVALAGKKSPNPVLAIEYLITASPRAWSRKSMPVDPHTFAKNALYLLEEMYESANVIAVNLQLDEATPHLVAYVVPLISVSAQRRLIPKKKKGKDGKLETVTHSYTSPAHYKLSAAATLDGRKKLHELQNYWHQHLGMAFQLERGQVGSGRKHIPPQRLYQLTSEGSLPPPTIPPCPTYPKTLPKPVDPGFLASSALKRSYQDGLSKWEEHERRRKLALPAYLREIEEWRKYCEQITQKSISEANKQRVNEERLEHLAQANTKLTKKNQDLTTKNNELRKLNSDLLWLQHLLEDLTPNLREKLEEDVHQLRMQQHERKSGGLRPGQVQQPSAPEVRSQSPNGTPGSSKSP